MAPEARPVAAYTGSMKMLLAAVAAWLALAPALRAEGLVLASRPVEETEIDAPAAIASPEQSAQIASEAEHQLEPRVLRPDAQGPMVFDGPVGGLVGRGLRPAYRLAETAADRVYDLLRTRLLGTLLPGRLTRGLEHSPEKDSYEVFESALRRKEERFASRLIQRYPHEAFDVLAGVGAREDRLREWRAWAAEEQQGVVVSAFEDALLSRYGLDRFGVYSETYARDRQNWDPSFLTMAGLIGGAFAYANGIRAEAPMGPVRVQLGLRAGYRIKDAVAAGGRSRLGHIQLAYRDMPVAVAFEWAVSQGRVVRDTVGLRYEKRF